MATLRDIRRRIRSARPYAIKMAELLSNLVGRAGDDAHPLLARRATGRRRLVIITADKGLCGAFNSNVLRASLGFLREPGQTDVTLVVVGKKARDFYRRRQWTVKSEMLGFFDRLAYSHAQELAGQLMQDYLTGEADEVHLLYNEFRSVAVQRVRRERLLPIESAPAAGAAPAVGGDYIYEPSAEGILAALLPRHVTTQVYRALMESVAGEYGARMTAMEAATKNAKEMIGILTIQYNKARQERITKELLDIVGGAEALRQAVEA
jgi:F-type H+-transporting ATPase subunit gamma